MTQPLDFSNQDLRDRLLVEGDRVSQRNLIQEYMPVGNVHY